MTTNDQTISSLAILKVNYDQRGRDFIDNFVPFAVESLRQAGAPGTTAAATQAVFRDTFGIAIPQGAVASILKRATRRELATSGTNGRFFITAAGSESKDLASARDGVVREQRGLIERLVTFSSRHGDRPWTAEESEAALIRFALARGTSVLATRGSLADQRPTTSPPDESHLLGEFVLDLSNADPMGFAALESLIKGALLASAMYYPDLGRLPSKFERLDVFVDTRFVLRALGTAGPEHQAACAELLELIFELGGNLRVFDNTLLEIRGVLNATSFGLRTPRALRERSGETLEYLASIGQRASDVELLMAQLPRRLANLRIKIVGRPPHQGPLTVDEPKFEALLTEGRPADRPYPAEALRHDVAALTAIHRLRGGQPQPVLETARAVFLTTNALLARAGVEFFREEYGVTGIPLCYSDHHFATLAWLKKPTAAPALPRLYVIADSYAALSPSDGLWRAYLAEISHLEQEGDISEEDYFALRFTTTAKAALVDLTDEGDDVAPTVPEILRRTREAIRSEIAADMESNQAEAFAKRSTEHETELERLRRQTNEANGRRQNQIRTISVGIGRWASRLVLTFGTVLVALFAYIGLSGVLPELPFSQLVGFKGLVYGGAFVFLVLSVANLAFGTSVRSVSRSFELWVTGHVSSLLNTRFG